MPSAGDHDLISTPSERDATAQLVAIAGSDNDAIISKDLAGRITSWNPGAERLYGYRAEEVLGQERTLLSSAVSRDAEAALLARVTAGEHITVVHTRRNHKNGTVLDVSLSLSPIVDGEGVIIGMASASRDIGDALSAQGLFEQLFQAAPDAMVCFDRAGSIVLVNEQAQRLFGYDPLELVGQPIGTLVPAEFRSTLATAFEAVVTNPSADRRVGDGALSAQRKDGSTVAVDLTLSSADLGATVVVVAAIRDVSSRLAAEAAVQQSGAPLGQLADSVDLAMSLRTVDPDRFVYVSPGYEKVFGYHPATADEGPIELVRRVLSEDQQLFLSEFSDPVSTGAPSRSQYRVVRPDGDIRWIRSTTTPVFDVDGVVRRCAIVAEDITDIARAEAELRAVEEATKADAAKNEFMSRISHELRTPLNAVLGFAQLLELDDLTGEQDTAVAHILHGSRHLVSLIDDVLDIARIESDRLDLSLESVLMSELIADAVAVMTPVADSARVRLSFLETADASQYVRGDGSRLRQVLLNLLSNAVKYNEPGGRVDVRCELADPTQLDIIVTDTGPGIPADDLPRLFTPFDRLGAEASDIEGSGVGLALAHRLMTSMGGTLRASSQVGVGSVFTASIPLATALDVAADVSAQAPVSGGQPVEVQAPTMTLLYVEANSSDIRLMQRLLAHRPAWHTLVATDAAAGIELATTRSPDLVLLDLHLPDLNGVDVLQRLNADPRTADLNVVIVSADASPAQMERLLAAGAHAYLTKPLDVVHVLELLDGSVPRSAGTPD